MRYQNYPTAKPNRKARSTLWVFSALAMLATMLASAGLTSSAEAQVPNCDGQTPTIIGSAVIWGTPGDDVILGSAGPDQISGFGGNDIICGGAGNDVITVDGSKLTTSLVFGDDGNDTITGSAGSDTLRGGNGTDIIRGGDGDDKLYGGAGADEIHGQDGKDRIWAGPGNDTVNGGARSDIIRGETGNDKLHGGPSGLNEIYGGNGRDTITGGPYSDTLDGGPGADLIRGGQGNDVIFGRGGNDVINGNGHNDVINGNGGNDTITGGPGDDDLTGGAGTDSANGNSGTDICRAETKTNCSAAQPTPTPQPTTPSDSTMPPKWIPEASALDIISIKQHLTHVELTVGWCCATAGDAAPSDFDLTISDSNGQSETVRVSAAFAWEYTFDGIGNYILDPSALHRVEVVAVNGAGRSGRLGAEEIPLIWFEPTESLGGALNAQSSNAQGLNSAQGSGAEPCGTEGTKRTLIKCLYLGLNEHGCATLTTHMELKKEGSWFFGLGGKEVTFIANSDQVCTDGTNITKNIASNECNGDGDREYGEPTKNPNTPWPDQPRVEIHYECFLDIETTSTISVASYLEQDGGGFSIASAFETEVHVQAYLSIKHLFTVHGQGLCAEVVLHPISEVPGTQLDVCRAIIPAPTG